MNQAINSWKVMDKKISIQQTKSASHHTEIIRFNNCELIPGVLDELPSFSQLYELRLSQEKINTVNCKVTTDDAKTISKIRLLKVLALDNNNFTSNGIRNLSVMNKLEKLWAGTNLIDDEGLHYISRMQSLTVLSLAFNRFGFEGAISLAKLVNLQELYVQSNEIGSIGLYKLSWLKKLSVLHLG